MTEQPTQLSEARQDWWDKRDQYKKELKISTHFHELEKFLFLASHLDPNTIENNTLLEDDVHYEFLQEASLDAQLKVLEVCSDFAKKKVSLDLAREEMEKAKEYFEARKRFHEDDLHMPEYRSQSNNDFGQITGATSIANTDLPVASTSEEVA